MPIPQEEQLPASGARLREGALTVFLIALFASLTLFDLRRDVHGTHAVLSLELIGSSLGAVLLAPLVWLRRRWIGRIGWWILGSFAVLWLWALASALTTERPLLQKVLVERRYLVAPVLQAGVCVLSAWGLALALPSHRRLQSLWWACAAVVACTPVAWWRGVNNGEISRLSTALGGAAVVHVGLLLCAAVFGAAALEDYRCRTSQVLCFVALVFVLASGSRAGLICMAVAILLLFLWGGDSHLVHRLRRLLLGMVLVTVTMVAVFPSLRRVLHFEDDLRSTNMATAWELFTSSGQNMLLGVGSGRLWPWLAFETGRLHMPWRGMGPTQFGTALTNPHSIFLGTAVELGLLGMVPLVVMFAAIGLGAWRGRYYPARSRQVVAIVLVATIPAFAFDQYLFKNFAVSFLWWLVLATVMGLRPTSRPAGGDMTP